IYTEGMPGRAQQIAVDAAGEIFEFSAETFFQGNRYLIDTLVETALGDHRGGTAWDLYSGVGLFTLPLARRFERVVAVEEYAPSVKFAKRNAHNAGLANIAFEEQSVRHFLREAPADSAGIDLVLLDPPRFGTEKDTMENLIRMQPAHVAYVACEPSVLARDLKRFDAAGFQIESITAIDLFPQTHHVETVVHLNSPR
nr:class I SAM-dependent RNA methyltransferase [Blastocatellia bacterium]